MGRLSGMGLRPVSIPAALGKDRRGTTFQVWTAGFPKRHLRALDQKASFAFLASPLALRRCGTRNGEGVEREKEALTPPPHKARCQRYMPLRHHQTAALIQGSQYPTRSNKRQVGRSTKTGRSTQRQAAGPIRSRKASRRLPRGSSIIARWIPLAARVDGRQ